jgi:hypothetical protein
LLRLAIVAAFILIFGVGVVLTQGTGQGRRKTAKAAPPSQDNRVYVATREITVDQVTGKVRKPTAEETRELVATLKAMTNRSSEGLRAVTHPNGTKQVTLEGRFAPVAIARPAADGTMEVMCVTTFAEAAEYLGLVEAGAEQAQ